jgi:phage terminase large subunit
MLPIENLPIPQDKMSDLNVGPMYIPVIECKSRIIAMEGGARSGKTYTFAQVLNTMIPDPKTKFKFSVVRKTGPALKATVMEDVFEIMKDADMYERRSHNKTDHQYTSERNRLEFFSVDDQQKLRGRKRDYLWINEANELSFHEFSQLAFRTSKQIWMDFNPVEEDHWIYEKVINIRDDVTLMHSNYLMNPFLEDELVWELEQLKNADDQYWRVFGLGERPKRGTKIYTHYDIVDDFGSIDQYDEVIYGIDYGFNVASAIVRIGIKENECTWDELFYKPGHTNSMLIKAMDQLRKDGEITSTMQGYADAAEPDRIEEMNYPSLRDDNDLEIEGFNVKKADKSVSDGIDTVKSRPMKITRRSTNVLDEAKKYSWKVTKDGTILDEPVKVKDHIMDAGRYGTHTYFKENAGGSANIRLL